MSQSFEGLTFGRPTEPSAKISTVVRHDYLRKSMVDRVERKAMLKNYRRSVMQETKDRLTRPTKTQQLRSISALQNMQQLQSSYMTPSNNGQGGNQSISHLGKVNR